MMKRRDSKKTYEGTTFFGFLFGLIVGGVVALLQGPRFPWESVKDVQERLDEAVNHDPLASGIEEGKAAARRQREQYYSS